MAAPKYEKLPTAMPKSLAQLPLQPPPQLPEESSSHPPEEPPAKPPAQPPAATAGPAQPGKPNTALYTEGKVPTHADKRRSWRWKIELLMCFLVFSVPFIAFGTLFPHRNNPLPQWPFRITINSLLAVYSTIFKAAISLVLSSGIAQLQWAWFASQRPLHDVVRYDDAGRGPWGSMRILWAHRLRQPLTALGALIMVLNIGVDPFVQQIVRTVDCSIHLENEQALLPRTNFFGDFVNTSNLQSSYSSDQLDLRSAVFDGIKSSGITQTAQCTTGNCTFPTGFTTLGICHECHDYSDKVTVDSLCIPKFPLWRANWDHCPMNSSVVINSTFTLNDVGGYMHTTFPWPTAETYNQSMPTALYPVEVFGMVYSANIAEMQIDFLVGETPYSQSRIDPFTGRRIDGCEKEDHWRCLGHGAASCTLKLCVREYSATVEAGLTKETLLSESTPMELPPRGYPPFQDMDNIPAILDSRCPDGNLGRDLEQRGYHLDTRDRWQVFNVSQDNRTTSPIYPSLFEKGCLFAIPNRLDLLMGISAVYEEIGFMLKTYVNPDGRLKPSFAVGAGVPETQEMLHIYNYGKADFKWIDGIMANLSESVTRFIRTHGSPNYSSPAVGFVWQHAVCARIDWWWSAYPIALAIGTLVFFALVLYLQDRKTPVWKSSPLAWILCNADAKTRGGSTGDTSNLQQPGKDELEKSSRDIGVLLRTDPVQCYQLGELRRNVKTRKPGKGKTSSKRPLSGTT